VPHANRADAAARQVLEEEAGRLGEQPAGQAALAGRGQAAEEQQGAAHGRHI
jgi:hypothetical protein